MLNKTLFILAVICMTAGISSAAGGSSYMEELVFCSTIKPDVNMIATRAGLNKGQWVKSFSDLTVIANPKGQRSLPESPLTICSSGKAGTPEGTSGYATFATEENELLDITWTNLFAGAEGSTMKYDDKTLRVTTSKPKANHVVYTVAKV